MEEIDEDIEVEARDSRAFYSDKGVEAFEKHLEKKGFVEKQGFKNLVSPFREGVEKRGWENVSKHMEPGRGALVKGFYAHLGERKDLTCYVWGDGSLLGKG